MHEYNPLRKKTNTSCIVRYTSCQDKHSVCIININHCLLYCGIIAVCSEIHTYKPALCGQNVEFVNIKPAVNKISTGL
jgi:hypothetical protein